MQECAWIVKPVVAVLATYSSCDCDLTSNC
jgi:hypothetical protein